MRKITTLLFIILLTMLSSCRKMTVKELAMMAEANDRECPVELSGIGDLVHVQSEDSTLIFIIQTYPEQSSDNTSVSSNTSMLRKDSLISRSDDTKTAIASIMFQPVTNQPLGVVLESDWRKNTNYDKLARMGGYLRVDLIGEDSTTFTSVTFNSQEMKKYPELCYQRNRLHPAVFDDILELHKAIIMLAVPTDQFDNTGIITAVDYDKESFNFYLEIDNASNFDEKKIHDLHIEAFENLIERQHSVLFRTNNVNDEVALIKACIGTNRNFTYTYRAKSNGKQFKVIVTVDELKKVLEKG